MSKTKYDFKALLAVCDRRDAIMESMLDIWGRLAGGDGSDGTPGLPVPLHHFLLPTWHSRRRAGAAAGLWLGLRTDSLSYAPF